METSRFVASRPGEMEAVLAPEPEFDFDTAPRFRAQLSEAIENGATRVVVDLRGVDFMDSTGLGTLVGGMKRLRGMDGELVLWGPSPRVRRVLDLTGLHRLFVVED